MSKYLIENLFGMEIRINTLTPEQFLDLYKSVGWESLASNKSGQHSKTRLLRLPVTMETVPWDWQE